MYTLFSCFANGNMAVFYSPGPESDDNANPSASVGKEQQLMDNYR
jgi:hypothetical protein